MPYITKDDDKCNWEILNSIYLKYWKDNYKYQKEHKNRDETHPATASKMHFFIHRLCQGKNA